MPALPYSDFETSKVLVPGSNSSSLGGKPQIFESKGGSRKKRSSKKNKRSGKKGGSRKLRRSKK
jgi:hypothetical protein